MHAEQRTRRVLYLRICEPGGRGRGGPSQSALGSLRARRNQTSKTLHEGLPSNRLYPDIVFAFEQVTSTYGREAL